MGKRLKIEKFFDRKDFFSTKEVPDYMCFTKDCKSNPNYHKKICFDCSQPIYKYFKELDAFIYIGHSTENIKAFKDFKNLPEVR